MFCFHILLFSTDICAFKVMDENFLQQKLTERKEQDAFRQLRFAAGKTDFCSNDYLGIATNRLIAGNTAAPGSGGSRLLAGNYPLLEATEQYIAAFHDAEAAIIYNSGYDANLGLLSCVPQRGDTIIYDQLSHASIRDGIRLSFATAQAFLHNDLDDLAKKLQQATGTIFVVTESVFSMDGDICPLTEMMALCEQYGAKLIIDEAHATGVVGERGEGLVQQYGYANRCFARIHTFGKACGVHGAVILGSSLLRDYLINFSRSLMYSTALPPSAVQHILDSYHLFPGMLAERTQLQLLIQQFRIAELPFEKLNSSTAIQAIIIPGNTYVKALAQSLQEGGFDVRPILYPTVPKGRERLRIVLHAFNTAAELEQLLERLKRLPVSVEP
jgi:8-amino-7-oxononanoate synthase